MVEEEAGDELAAGAGPGLLEDRLEVVLDRPGRKLQPLGIAAVSKPCATSWVTTRSRSVRP